MPFVKLGMGIGDWVKCKIHRIEGLTQITVARELGISQQALSRKIKNNSFTYDNLVKLFKIFHSDADEIVNVMSQIF